MALFNKLFSSHKSAASKNLENVLSEKVYSLRKDQVRIVLFRECDFRGRKLLFDSHLVQRISLDTSTENVTTKKCSEKYIEVSDGFGYWYMKPSADVNRFGEMVFGSVAMSYRGTSFKIHTLKSPCRIMCSQIFPSPKHRSRTSSSAPSQTFINSLVSCHSLEQSLKLDDSTASSSNSISDCLSICSLTSDNGLTASRRYNSVPLDLLPVGLSHLLSGNSPNTNVDSGFSGERLTNSCCSVATTFYEGEEIFSCGSLYKRWLRSASTSLEPSPNVSSLSDDCLLKPQVRRSKLGLALIIELPLEHECFLEQFLMEHSTLIESMIWRTRQGVEVAYLRRTNFVSLVYQVATNTVQWLLDLLSGPQLSANLWNSLAPVCDNYFDSINVIRDPNTYCSALRSDNLCESFDSSIESADAFNKISDFTFFNFTKFFKSAQSCGTLKSSCSDKNLVAEKCVGELCELLDCVDIKHTNFFISTLITAVLTHHLGWVTTILPSSTSDDAKMSSLGNKCNPLWGQLADLYGATGHPTKIAHTIVTGTNKVELITKILNSLTYFIRCSNVHRKCVSRVDTQVDNKTVDCICQEEACIPKENYKIYADHLKDLKIIKSQDKTQMVVDNLEACRPFENIEMINLNDVQIQKSSSGLKSQKSFAKNLSTMDDSNKCLYPNLEMLDEYAFHKANERCQVISRENDKLEFTNSVINEKVKKICRVPTSAVSYHASTTNEKIKLLDIQEISENAAKIYEPKKVAVELQTKSVEEPSNIPNVLFVLGDNDELVGLKKSDEIEYSSSLSNLNNIKPSTSCINLQTSNSSSSKFTIYKKFDRSQSAPPDEKKKIAVEKKYRYSGVKFNIYRYPQIVTNYMKSKNLELSHLPFTEKCMKFNNADDYASFECSDYQFDEVEALQTPSNASELEFTSDLSNEDNFMDGKNLTIKKTVVTEHPLQIFNDSNEEGRHYETWKEGNEFKKMKIIDVPFPKSKELPETSSINYASSLMRGMGERYISDMVLQGTSAPTSEWESALRKDLSLSTQHSLLDQPIDEAVAIVANTDTWEVQLFSSHMYVVDRGLSGIRLGMSQLVANMLESLLQMWKLHTPPEYCIIHIEQRLQEFCSLSKALAELLLETEFCSIDLLTSVLQLEVNDIPLLMAVASTHSPLVTQKYGISFQ